MTNQEQLRAAIGKTQSLTRRRIEIQKELLVKLTKPLYYLGAWVTPYPGHRPNDYENRNHWRWVCREDTDEKQRYEMEVYYGHNKRWWGTGTTVTFTAQRFADAKFETPDFTPIGTGRVEFMQAIPIHNELSKELTCEVERIVETTIQHRKTTQDAYSWSLMAGFEGGKDSTDASGWKAIFTAQASVGGTHTRGKEEGNQRREQVSNKFDVVVPPKSRVDIGTEVTNQKLRRVVKVAGRLDWDIRIDVRRNSSAADRGWSWDAFKRLGVYHNVGQHSFREDTGRGKMSGHDLACVIEADSMSGLVDELCGVGAKRWDKDPLPVLGSHCRKDLVDIVNGSFAGVETRVTQDCEKASVIRFVAKEAA